MARIFFVLILALIFEAVGVVLLSRGLKQIGEPRNWSPGELLQLAGRGATNRLILAGVGLEAIFFGTLLYLLAKSDVSLIWPLTSMGFVLTTLAAWLLGGEHVSPLRWTGVILIVLGAAVVGWSEKRPGPPSPAGVASRDAG